MAEPREAPIVEIWDAGGELRYSALQSGVENFEEARRALLRGRAWLAETRRMNESKDWALTVNGELWGVKLRIGEGAKTENRIFAGSVRAVAYGRWRDFQEACEAKRDVFVLAYIVDRNPQDLPLGFYTVQGRLTNGEWELRAKDPFAEAAPASAPAERPGPEPRSDEERRVRPRVEPTRFVAGADAFDSLLECVHRQAFQRLGLQYDVPRQQCDVGVPPQRYCMDGLLYVGIGAPGPLQVVHVEIKPGPLKPGEAQKCYEYCKKLSQAVLCVMGGYVPRSERGGGDDYGDRARPCVEMALYAPMGPGREPLYYPAVVWRWDGDALFLSGVDVACPVQRLEAQRRLQAVYTQASVEARQLAGGGHRA